ADRTFLVDRTTQHVHDPTQGFNTHGYRDRCAGIFHVQATLEAFGAAHGDGTNHAITQLLLNFQSGFTTLDQQRVIYLGHGIARKFHVDDRADDLNDTSATHARFLVTSVICAASNRCSATHDFGNFLGDRRLTGLV